MLSNRLNIHIRPIPIAKADSRRGVGGSDLVLCRFNLAVKECCIGNDAMSPCNKLLLISTLPIVRI